MADEKKGITVKIDAGLHAEIRQYIEQNGMTMAEFVSQALYNELHPKIQPQEVKYMGPTRTMAFQMPEEMFQKLKDYLHRHNITQTYRNSNNNYPRSDSSLPCGDPVSP